MRAQNRSRCLRADFSFEAEFYCLRFPAFRNHANYLIGLQNLAYGHRNGSSGDFGNICEPSLTDLLEPASLIEFHDQIRLVLFKIRRRVIEGQVSVLPNTNESDIDGSRA